MSKRYPLLCAAVALLLIAALAVVPTKKPASLAFVTCEVDLRRTEVKLYWKDEQNQRFKSLLGLKSWLGTKGQKLLFAMNAGMFNAHFSPQGLFIQEGATIAPLDTTTKAGNFYLKPNGVFYLTSDNTASICRTEDFVANGRVTYATQSGPMLLIIRKHSPGLQSRLIPSANSQWGRNITQ